MTIPAIQMIIEAPREAALAMVQAWSLQEGIFGARLIGDGSRKPYACQVILPEAAAGQDGCRPVILLPGHWPLRD